MADRFVLKQFAGSATNNGAFGAAQATGVGVQPVANIKDVQTLNAFEQGWNSATLTADKLPALEEMQGLEALLCKAIKENYSEGIPLWISGETYYQDSRAVYNGKVYRNKTGSYTANNPATDTANWELDKPDTAGTADKLGSSNVGSSTQPMYLSSGIATASTATVGTATKPVYLSAGTITQGDELAKIDLSNINASGEQVIKNLITASAANVDLSNLSATGNAKFQAPITGAATTITSSNLTASRALTSNASGKVAISSVTSTELGYVSGVTSAIQTQLNAKQATITGAATTIASSNLTASRALISNSSGKVAVSSITSTKLGYLTDVTSNIQAQLDGKANTSLSNVTSTGKLTAMGWSTPDYSSGIQFSIGVEYSCPSIGVVVVRGVISNNYLYPLQINGNSVAYSYNAGSSQYNGTYSAEFIVSKGDKIIINDQLSGGSGIFYPMKGV